MCGENRHIVFEIIHVFFDTSHNKVRHNKITDSFINSKNLLNIFFSGSLIDKRNASHGAQLIHFPLVGEVSDLHVWACNIIQFRSLFSNLHNSSLSPCCSPMVILIPSPSSHGRPCSIIVIN